MDKLSNNSLAFLALANEYCHAIETASATEQADFVANMLRLLPRIYISASDLIADDTALEETFIDNRLDENSYNEIAASLSALLGADDTYLEVFVEDMKYSDTPISATISEGLADIYQSLYNLLDSVRDMPVDVTIEMLSAARVDFQDYWSQILCNIMRPLNAIRNTNDTEY